MKKGSAKCKTGGKASSKKAAPTKKMADGGKPPATGKPNRKIFSLNPLKKRVKTKYGAVTGQGNRTPLERSAPTVKKVTVSRSKPAGDPVIPKKEKSVTRHKNVRFL